VGRGGVGEAENLRLSTKLIESHRTQKRRGEKEKKANLMRVGISYIKVGTYRGGGKNIGRVEGGRTSYG